MVGFIIGNMRIGGPYKVTVSFIGYDTRVIENINLSLGNVSNISVDLSEKTTELTEVVISDFRSDVINSDRTGAATNVSNEMINSVPSITRGLRDITKLSPFANVAGSGTSFSGTNNRYNQFAIDGLINNDVFGLSSSGTNGGQTGIEPVSLDAIEEFQINIAPYDVRQGGFTGGGINAVTKSGTNQFHGTAYFFGNNQSLVGQNNPVDNTTLKYPEYKDFQGGISLGGPIIKNKLFFFVNGEMSKNTTPLDFAPGTSSSNITLEEVNRVLAVMNRVAPGYDAGNYNDITDETSSKKLLVKINYNINDKHKLTLRHSYTYGENTDNSRTSNALRFSNNGQFFPSTTNSTGLELNSLISKNTTNRLLLGYTTVRDDRDPLGSPFPTVLVHLGSSKSITLGSEYSSVANQLDQNILTLTDDYVIYKDKHTFTIGTHLESYKFYNIFVQNIYGSYAYNSLANFESIGTDTVVAPSYYAKSYSFQTDDDPSQSKGAAEFNAFQLGFYGQDEIQITKDFVLTAGIRFDLPIFPDTPGNNAAFDSAYSVAGAATGTLPKTRILISPRVGFNWDVKGDKSLQLRGGTGLFTGRVPFVWVSNQFTNNGQLIGSYSVGNSASSGTPISNPAGLTFNADPYDQPFAEDLGKKAGRGAINVIDEDFKFPQVFRSNIALDKTLPGGIIATVEAIFSKTLNNINFTNLNRTVAEDFTFAGPDQRPRYTARSTDPTNKDYNSASRIDGDYEEIIYLQNTNEGYSYNLMIQLQKQLDNGLSASASYNYGHSEDLNSGTSSVAYSNWRYVNNVNGLNNLELSTSNFNSGSRIMGFVSYKKEYAKGLLSTQVSLFYNGQSGQPLSYIYNGDMNNDATSNDLIFIPETKEDINLIDILNNDGTVKTTVEQQWTALNSYIDDDKYLSEHRGEYAERNGAKLPFSHQFDFRLLQEIKIKTGKVTNKFQITFDIQNIGNLINKEWGRQYFAPNLQSSLIDFKGLADSDTGAGFDYSENKPTFTYSGGGLINNNPYSTNDFYSRWRAQIGLRYIF